MGGLVTLMARFEDDSRVAVKVSTSEIGGTWNSVAMLDESNFKSTLAAKGHKYSPANSCSQHRDYDDDGSAFAPYHYGLIFFDFKEKEVFSANDYCRYALLSSYFIRHECLVWPSADIDHLMASWSLEPAVNAGAIITCEGGPIVYPAGDVNAVRTKIAGFDPLSLSREQIMERLDSAAQMKDHTYLNDVKISMPDWIITNGDNRKHYIRAVLQYCLEQNLLTPLDIECWEEHLAEL
ncbi:hypothetical protein RYA05_00855 [Pseudomonas syringae pv. actinidiae]|nr:hypothetical protein [Pseudomonas syringae pv. actinidiae]